MKTVSRNTACLVAVATIGALAVAILANWRAIVEHGYLVRLRLDDREDRLQSVDFLRRRGGRRSLEALVRVVREDSDLEVREAAMRALAERKSEVGDDAVEAVVLRLADYEMTGFP